MTHQANNEPDNASERKRSVPQASQKASPDEPNSELRERIAEHIHYLTDDSDILSSGIRGTIDRIISEVEAALIQAERQGWLNGLTQLKIDRMNHLLSVPTDEVKREIDFIDEQIKALSQNTKERGSE